MSKKIGVTGGSISAVGMADSTRVVRFVLFCKCSNNEPKVTKPDAGNQAIGPDVN